MKKKEIEKKNDLLQKGYEIIEIENKLDEIYKIDEKIKVNSYVYKDILSKDTIENIVNFIFKEKNIAGSITYKTGFCYSVDFIIGYETLNVPKIDLNKEWYANNWHNDKPFTKNTLKLIIPLNSKNEYQSGGIEILDIYQSKLYEKSKTLPIGDEIFVMQNKLNELLIFNPNLCYHKAGNPDENSIRKQLMIQLNPTNTWKINQNLYQKQMKIEPKFPFFNFLFDKKNILKL